MASVNPCNRILAVDGGGSKTTACIANARLSSQRCGFELDILGRGIAGPSNPRSVGFEVAFTNLAMAITSAQESLPIDPSPFSAACLSLAGAGRGEEQKRIRAWADDLRLANQTIVVDDIEPIRFAAMFEQDGFGSTEASNWEQSIALIVGTGSIACGSSAQRGSARVGGWGYLLGDEGSGFAIGLAGLRSVCESYDRGESSTLFQHALLSKLDLSSPTALVPFLYQTPLPRAAVAELSSIVFANANDDLVAYQIVEDSIKSIVHLVTITIRRLGMEHQRYSLALSGGILCSQPAFVERILLELERKGTAPLISHLVRDPIHGPLWMAARLL